MKKLFISAVLVIALASCKKEAYTPETATATVEVTCDDCRIVSNYKQSIVMMQNVTGVFTFTIKADIGSAVNTQMFVNPESKTGSIQLRVLKEGKQIFIMQSGENYPVNQLFYASVVIKK